MFLGILASFADLFAQSIHYMRTRFKARGATGLYVALAERVSAINRLGSYYFTRFLRSLLRFML